MALLACVWVGVCAQQSVPLSHQAWSTEEGLPDPGVHQVFQSRDGYLWLATEGGAVRFDGLGFKVLNRQTQPVFTSNDVSAIAQDVSGALWFGTADGLVEIAGTTPRRFAEQDGLPSSEIVSLATADDGSLLVVTTAGLVRFDGKVFKPLGPNETGVALQMEPGGAVWLLEGEGLFQYQHGSLQRSAISISTSAPVLGLQFGMDGAVWMRFAHSITVAKGAFHKTLELGSDLPGSRMTALFVDHEGTGWVGTNRGLYTYRAEPQSVVSSVAGLRNDSVLSVFEDRESNIWIGTEASGLHALRPRKFRSVAAATGEAVTAVVTMQDGSAWFGTRDDGIRVLRGAAVEEPVHASSLTSPVVLSMARGNHGDIWVGTPDGLNHVTGHIVQQYTSGGGLPDDFIRSVLADSHGEVWAGTRRGLVRMDAGGIRTYTRQDGLGSDSIGPLLEARTKLSGARAVNAATDLWVGTAAGLSHLHGARIESYSPQPQGAIVTALAEDPTGSLWVAVHDEGLNLFTGGRFLPTRMAATSKEITSLVADDEGYLWMRSSRGLFRASAAALRSCAEQSSDCGSAVTSYSTADGLPSDSLTMEATPSTSLADSGDVWFATRKGLAIADPAHMPVNSVPPPVVIQRFQVDGTEVATSKEEIQIGAGSSRYTFDYTALSYTIPSKNRYRYMLEGFDTAWINAGNMRSADYTNLPAGHYRFLVDADNNDGVWSRSGADVRFHILPHFYRRWWFYVLVLLALAGVAATVFRLRGRAIQRRFALVLEERNRVAREIHDTLAQDFVSVSLQLEIATQLLKMNEVGPAVSQLQATRTLVKHGLAAARQGIWNLRANIVGDTLPARLSDLVKNDAGGEPAPQLKMGGAYRKLPERVEGEILRVAQESLSNVRRHAAATEVSVDLHYDRDTLLLCISDNGRGFSAEAADNLEGHYGLRGLRERAANIGAELTITSNLGEGTTIALLVVLQGKEVAGR